MILLGKRFKASVAQAYGLLHQVVPPDELDTTVAALADKFQRLPPRTVGIAKRIINLGYNLSRRDSQNLEIDAQAELLDSPDCGKPSRVSLRNADHNLPESKAARHNPMIRRATHGANNRVLLNSQPLYENVTSHHPKEPS